MDKLVTLDETSLETVSGAGLIGDLGGIVNNLLKGLPHSATANLGGSTSGSVGAEGNVLGLPVSLGLNWTSTSSATAGVSIA